MILIFKKNNRGFTLLEAILAVFVTAVGVLGAYGLSQQILAYSSLSNSNFTAAYLAKEGIEIVRNIRDSNWVEEAASGVDIAWDYSLDAGDYEVDYNAILSSVSGNCLNLNNLKLETATGLFGYGAVGNQTKYKRKITIESLADGSLRVSSEVCWQEKGQTKSITAQDILYEWWQ